MPSQQASGAAGISSRRQSVGTDIWPILTRNPNQPSTPRELYWQGVRRKSAALRVGDWKLVVHRRPDNDRIELFDLQTDPNEQKDRSSAEPDRVAAMLEALARQEKRDNDALPNDVR